MATQTRQRGGIARRRHRFTVEDYHLMVEVGVLDEYDRVELIGGEVVEMSAMGARHAATLEYLVDELPEMLPREEVVLRVQTPLAIPQYDEPEPDVSVVKRRSDRYRGRVPGPADTLLVIEVSDSTLNYDRGTKLAIYARAGIPETWIVDLATREGGIERHSDPDPATGVYRSVTRFGRGEVIVSTVLPDIAFPVDEVLGSRP